MPTDYYDNESKKKWYSSGEKPTSDQLKLGCLQRIADATELMSKNYQKLQEDRDYLKRWFRKHTDEISQLESQRTGLRAALSRKKNEASKLKEELEKEREYNRKADGIIHDLKAELDAKEMG